MNPPVTFSRSVLAVAIAAALSVTTASSALAAGAVTLQNWGSGAGDAPSIGAGASLSVVKSLPKSNYSDNPDLSFSAWAHAGGSPWWTFNLTAAADTTIRLAAETAIAAFKPGLTVWASGNSKFDGGESAVNTEVASNGWDTPHSFNAVGQLGDFGTYWMSGDGVATYSNMQETLAYGVTGPGHAAGGWGETIEQGIHDVSVDNRFEQGITGSYGENWLELRFNQLQPGWYVVFAGGTDHSLSAQNMILSVNAVPEPGTWGMLAAGLSLLALARGRRMLRS